MSRARPRQEMHSFEISVPDTLFKSLVHLASHTPYGGSEHAIAVWILAKETDRMAQAGEYGLKPIS